MRYLGALLVLATAAGCIRDDGGGVDAPVGGSWDYEAIQTVPASPPTTLSGTLEITAVESGTFSGTLSGTMTVTGAGASAFGGVVSGTSVDETTVDFDAYLSGPTTGRRHVGVITGDSLAGNWVETAGMTTLQGTFRAARQP